MDSLSEKTIIMTHSVCLFYKSSLNATRFRDVGVAAAFEQSFFPETITTFWYRQFKECNVE